MFKEVRNVFAFSRTIKPIAGKVKFIIWSLFTALHHPYLQLAKVFVMKKDISDITTILFTTCSTFRQT